MLNKQNGFYQVNCLIYLVYRFSGKPKNINRNLLEILFDIYRIYTLLIRECSGCLKSPHVNILILILQQIRLYCLFVSPKSYLKVFFISQLRSIVSAIILEILREIQKERSLNSMLRLIYRIIQADILFNYCIK